MIWFDSFLKELDPVICHIHLLKVSVTNGLELSENSDKVVFIREVFVRELG